MPNDDQLSGEDITYLMQARASLPAGDPRVAKLDAYIKSQLANYVPDATKQAQQKIQSLSAANAPERAMQQTMGGPPMFTDVPAGQKQSFEQAGQSAYQTGGKIGLASLAIPGAIEAPLATATAIGGGYLGGKAAKKGAQVLGGGETAQDFAEFGGSLVGGGLGAGGGAMLQNAIKNAAPSTLRAEAGATLGTLKQVAGKVPVNTADFGDTALELWTQSDRGATLPTAVRKLVNRITTPGKAPVTYEEAKDFQSNISNLLANPVGEEGARLKNPNTYRLVTELNQKLKGSLEQASQLGGAQPGTFSGAMQDYHDAASREAMVQRLHDLSLKGIKLGAKGAGFGAASALGYDLYKILKDENQGSK